MKFVIIDDETGGFVAVDELSAVVAKGDEPGSLVYCKHTEDCFFSPLPPKTILERAKEAA
jgi:hypothetical protein